MNYTNVLSFKGGVGKIVETSERKLKRIAVITYYIQLPHVTGGVQCCCFQFSGLFIMACPKVFVRVCVCVILNRDHPHTPVTSENGGGQMITDIFLWPP